MEIFLSLLIFFFLNNVDSFYMHYGERKLTKPATKVRKLLFFK
jgi:hypothetical protein